MKPAAEAVADGESDRNRSSLLVPRLRSLSGNETRCFSTPPSQAMLVMNPIQLAASLAARLVAARPAGYGLVCTYAAADD